MINRENGIPLENEASPGSTEIFEEVSEGESCDVQASSSQENLEKSSVCRLSDGELEVIKLCLFLCSLLRIIFHFAGVFRQDCFSPL